MGRLFGTDGVRGVANVAPMDSETVLRLGRAAAHVFKRSDGQTSRILIGKDTRLSGYMLETALESGISSMGVDVLLLGPLPTPGVAFMTRSMRAEAGIMISASHNPYEDNGIKFFGADGYKLDDAMEDKIEDLMKPGRLDSLRATPDAIGKAYRIDDAVGRYTVYLKSCLDRALPLHGKKVVLDCAHGAAYKIAPLVFAELGVEVVSIGDQPDGMNINEGCGSVHPERMCQVVQETGADCGIAFDGDADRVILCDERGELIDGDLLLALNAIDLKSRGALPGDAVVGTVMSNLGLERALKDHGIALHRSDVGDRYVLAMMQEKGIVLGGEQSGHVIFLEHNTTGDGILSALMTLATMCRRDAPFSSIQSLISRYPQVLRNVKVKEKPPFEELPKVQDALLRVEQQLAGVGRVLLRYSGTEPKARVMVECEDKALCMKVADELVTVVQTELS